MPGHLPPSISDGGKHNTSRVSPLARRWRQSGRKIRDNRESSMVKEFTRQLQTERKRADKLQERLQEILNDTSLGDLTSCLRSLPTTYASAATRTVTILRFLFSFLSFFFFHIIRCASEIRATSRTCSCAPADTVASSTGSWRFTPFRPEVLSTLLMQNATRRWRSFADIALVLHEQFLV